MTKPRCQGKTKKGQSCSRSVPDGLPYCWQHLPDETETEQDVYERLEKATSAERTDIVLSLIEAHPEGRLELPERDGMRANLQGIDLSLNILKVRRTQFQQSPLRGADLQGVILTDANLQKADLVLANLQGAFLWKANLQGANLLAANLQDANLGYADLQGASLLGTNLQGASLWNTNLQKADLGHANLQDATLLEANLQNAILRNTKLQQVDLLNCESLAHIYIENAWLDHTHLRQNQLGGEIGEELAAKNKQLTALERVEKYAVAKHAYLGLKQNFDSLGRYEASSWAYRKERRMEKLEAREAVKAAFSEKKLLKGISNFTKYLGDKIVEISCDYGEGGWRVFVWILAFIFVIGPTIFWRVGSFEWSDQVKSIYYSYPTRAGQNLYTYCQIVLYTIDTFTTANFAEIKPINDFTRFISGCLAMTGIFLIGLLGFVAGNRIRRS